jgi:hypothetical protein
LPALPFKLNADRRISSDIIGSRHQGLGDEADRSRTRVFAERGAALVGRRRLTSVRLALEVTGGVVTEGTHTVGIIGKRLLEANGAADAARQNWEAG